ncbi:MAG: hypothetical protein AAFN77_00725 [Planctomycetota bacterium]
MWRTLLLGKLAISIIASLVVGYYCFSYGGDGTFTVSESMRWKGIGAFFSLLALAQIGVVFLLNRKQRRKASNS